MSSCVQTFDWYWISIVFVKIAQAEKMWLGFIDEKQYSNLVSNFQADLNQEHSTPTGKPFWCVFGINICVIVSLKRNSIPGVGFQKTEVGFSLTFDLGFAPFIFIWILTNSPVPADYL